MTQKQAINRWRPKTQKLYIVNHTGTELAEVVKEATEIGAHRILIDLERNTDNCYHVEITTWVRVTED